jgi:hypothetical protein
MAADDNEVGVIDRNTTNVVNVDTSLLTNDEGVPVNRQRLALGDAAIIDALAQIINTKTVGTEYGLITRLIPGYKDFLQANDLLEKILEAILRLGPFDKGLDLFGRVPVTPTPPNIQPVNLSGAIRVAGAAQPLLQSSRVTGFEIQNLSPINNMGISIFSPTPIIGGNSTYTVGPGQLYTSPWAGIVPSLNVFIIGISAGDLFTGQWW